MTQSLPHLALKIVGEIIDLSGKFSEFDDKSVLKGLGKVIASFNIYPQERTINSLILK